MNIDKVIEYAKEQEYDTVIPLGEWRGYEIYEPTFAGDGPFFIGPPLMIMTKGGVIRMSTVDEAMEQIASYE